MASSIRNWYVKKKIELAHGYPKPEINNWPDPGYPEDEKEETLDDILGV